MFPSVAPGRIGLAAESRGDDLEALVPDYVTLPRGVSATTGEVAWSRAELGLNVPISRNEPH
jgi:hypothetical protein